MTAGNPGSSLRDPGTGRGEQHPPEIETSLTGEPAAPHHVGLALRSLAAGAAAGLAFTAATLWLVRTLQLSGLAPAAPGPSGLVVTLVFLSWLGGGGLATAVAFALLAPLSSAYRRGALAMVAGLGTLPLGFLTQPVDGLLGRAGLGGLTAVAGVTAALLIRAIARGRA